MALLLCIYVSFIQHRVSPSFTLQWTLWKLTTPVRGAVATWRVSPWRSETNAEQLALLDALTSSTPRLQSPPLFAQTLR